MSIEKIAKSVLVEPPSKFVGLHAHSGGSAYDGLGYPDEHIDFVLENEMDAWSLTDHGNANMHAHARKHFQKVTKSGRKFRQLYGVEFYFVPSLSQWKIDYEKQKEVTRKIREDAKLKATDMSNELEEEGHVIENEDESKSVDITDNEWKRRYHLVVIAQNREGLGNLYTLVKKSYKDGFYRYPRIDFDLLKQHNKGLIVSTSCLAGIYNNRILRGNALKTPEAEIKQQLHNLTDRFVDAVGRERFFLELQFNKLDIQHEVNQHILMHAKETGLSLISTADSHYPRPERWQARELYKKLGWIGDKDQKPSLPKKEDLKCELYPKNARQMWDEYLAHKEQYSFYEGTEQIVKESIERTHDIAWQMCEDTWIDTTVKLPNFSTPEKSAFSQLAELVKQGLINEGLDKKPEYIARAKFELGVIETLKFENYFLVMQRVFEKSANKTLFGCSRGSAGGSLTCYLLGITQVDPVKYGLLFERFLSLGRTSWPDVDCIDARHRILLPNNCNEIIGNLHVNDAVVDANGKEQKILFIAKRKANLEKDTIIHLLIRNNDVYGHIATNHKHRLLLENGEQIYANEIKIGTKLDGGIVIAIKTSKDTREIVDVTIENASTFRIIPYDIIVEQNKCETSYISINSYDIDIDTCNGVLNDIQENRFRSDFEIFKLFELGRN